MTENPTRRARVLFAVFLVLALLAPLAVLLPFAWAVERFNPPDLVGIGLIVAALLAPLPLLYLAARQAVEGKIPGIAVLGAWWLISVLPGAYGLVVGAGADALIKAATFGVIAPSGVGGTFLTPIVLTEIGASRSFSIDLPIYLLWLMASYTAIKSRMRKRANADAHDRLYLPWDESGERDGSSQR